MLKLKVLELLKKKNKTKYWLYIQLNMSYQNFNNMISNKTKCIKYEHIELLCELLDCSPNDLFEKVEEK